MNNNLTEVVVILDRSGSMSSRQEDVIGGFNDLLKRQSESKLGECKLTVVQFDHEYQMLHNATPIEKVSSLDGLTYVPRGSTALLDAVCRTINSVGARYAAMKEEERPAKVVFVIFTDGMENCSHEFDLEKAKNMIEHQSTKYSWEFIYMGASVEAFAGGKSLGITNCYFNHNTAKGTKMSYAAVSNALFGLRSSDRCISADVTKELEDLAKEDNK